MPTFDYSLKLEKQKTTFTGNVYGRDNGGVKCSAHHGCQLSKIIAMAFRRLFLNWVTACPFNGCQQSHGQAVINEKQTNLKGRIQSTRSWGAVITAKLVVWFQWSLVHPCLYGAPSSTKRLRQVGIPRFSRSVPPPVLSSIPEITWIIV